jgi:hypothetical protein
MTWSAMTNVIGGEPYTPYHMGPRIWRDMLEVYFGWNYPGPHYDTLRPTMEVISIHVEQGKRIGFGMSRNAETQWKIFVLRKAQPVGCETGHLHPPFQCVLT